MILRNFYTEYAVYQGITYLRVGYLDKVELFDIDDIDHKNLLFTLLVDIIQESYTVINHAVLNGIAYVFYEIKNDIVTYSTTHANKKYLQKNIKEFDLIYQQINRGIGKPIEKKIIYINEEKVSVESVNLKFRPEEMANGSIMFSVNSDIISLIDVYEALNILYSRRLSDRRGVTSALVIDEIVSWISIDGIRINIDQDLCWGITTVFPDQKSAGEKYIFEIIDYFNKVITKY